MSTPAPRSNRTTLGELYRKSFEVFVHPPDRLFELDYSVAKRLTSTPNDTFVSGQLSIYLLQKCSLCIDEIFPKDAFFAADTGLVVVVVVEL